MTSNKMTVKLAFARACRKWPQAGRFPAVQATLARNDQLRIVDRSSRRRGVVIARWDEGRVLTPILEGA